MLFFKLLIYNYNITNLAALSLSPKLLSTGRLASTAVSATTVTVSSAFGSN
jgi:hypothetical protein